MADDAALREHSRRSDLVARYGGEEFAVLGPDTDCETGMRVAEHLRVATERLGPEQLGHPGPQTVSLGVAVQSPTRELTPSNCSITPTWRSIGPSTAAATVRSRGSTAARGLRRCVTIDAGAVHDPGCPELST